MPCFTASKALLAALPPHLAKSASLPSVAIRTVPGVGRQRAFRMSGREERKTRIKQGRGGFVPLLLLSSWSASANSLKIRFSGEVTVDIPFV